LAIQIRRVILGGYLTYVDALYRITAVMKVETDIITSIAPSLTGLVIIFSIRVNLLMVTIF